MARFNGMSDGMAKAVRNFHLPLSEPLYRRLRDAAARANQPATTVARYALEHWLREHRKAVVREAIAAYAAEVGGTRDDLDSAFEAASREWWSPPKRGKRKR
jgi:hypothetical protein